MGGLKRRMTGGLMSFPRATAQDFSITSVSSIACLLPPHLPITLAPAASSPVARATSFAPSPVPSSLPSLLLSCAPLCFLSSKAGLPQKKIKKRENSGANRPYLASGSKSLLSTIVARTKIPNTFVQCSRSALSSAAASHRRQTTISPLSPL